MAIESFPPPQGLEEIKKQFGKGHWMEGGEYVRDQKRSGWLIPQNSTWERDRLTIVRRLPGAIRRSMGVQIHVDLVDYLLLALDTAHASCPDYRIRQIGGYAPRLKRGSSKQLSTHAYGCAIDINWSTNPMKKKELVTDMSPEFVKAFTDLGWEWGGAWTRPKDAQHFQYAGGY